MKGNMYQPMLVARHSLPCFAVLALQHHESDLLQAARIIRSTACNAQPQHRKTIFLSSSFLALSDYSRLQALSVYTRDALFFVVELQQIKLLWRLAASWHSY
jgi:hypothetical protein